MNKIVNIFLLLTIIIFFFFTYNYYSSKNNVEIKKYNRGNIDQIINEKISDLPILDNDTDNVIEFNDGFTNQPNDKPRSFWNLIKFK